MTPDGLFEYNVLPAGLSNNKAIFQMMMGTVMREFLYKIFPCYVDDIVVYFTTFSEHVHCFKIKFSCLRRAGLQLNRKMCHTAYQEIRILGHVVSATGTSRDPDEVSAVSNFSVPKNTKNRRSFVGMCSYFRRFIRGYAESSPRVRREFAVGSLKVHRGFAGGSPRVY